MSAGYTKTITDIKKEGIYTYLPSQNQTYKQTSVSKRSLMGPTSMNGSQWTFSGYYTLSGESQHPNE